MTLITYLQYVILPILALSVVILMVRFLMGPRIVDRVISLDLLVTTGVGIIAIYSIVKNNSTFLDVTLILTLLAFLGTVGFSYYIQKRKLND